MREISESKNVGFINDYVARLVIIYLLRMSLFFTTNLTPFSYLNRATIKLIAFSNSYPFSIMLVFKNFSTSLCALNAISYMPWFHSSINNTRTYFLKHIYWSWLKASFSNSLKIEWFFSNKAVYFVCPNSGISSTKANLSNMSSVLYRYNKLFNSFYTNSKHFPPMSAMLTTISAYLICATVSVSFKNSFDSKPTNPKPFTRLSITSGDNN